jgi:hypothetical protein
MRGFQVFPGAFDVIGSLRLVRRERTPLNVVANETLNSASQG